MGSLSCLPFDLTGTGVSRIADAKRKFSSRHNGRIYRWTYRRSLFCRECLDVSFAILGKGNPNSVRLRIDRNAVRTRGAYQRRQRRESFVIEAHNGDGAQAACTVNALQRRVVCDLVDLGGDVGGSHDLARALRSGTQSASSAKADGTTAKPGPYGALRFRPRIRPRGVME
jgi:hypothetical protein